MKHGLYNFRVQFPPQPQLIMDYLIAPSKVTSESKILQVGSMQVFQT